MQHHHHQQQHQQPPLPFGVDWPVGRLHEMDLLLLRATSASSACHRQVSWLRSGVAAGMRARCATTRLLANENAYILQVTSVCAGRCAIGIAPRCHRRATLHECRMLQVQCLCAVGAFNKAESGNNFCKRLSNKFPMYLLTAYNGDTTKGLSSMGSGNNWQQSFHISARVFMYWWREN